jgi:ComF family protein
MASELSDYMGQFLRRNITALPKQALLVPVPLHPKRERWRGFNQSEKLGRIIGRYMGWKVISNLLIRTKLTRPQVELSGDERRKNLKGVFVINPKISIPLSAYNTPVILFDDVITTGATVKEAGKVLKRIGFKNVWGLSVAS